MTQTTTTPDFPPPAGAVRVHDWERPRGGMPYRFVLFADRTVTDHPVRVSAHAFQWADGALADGTGAGGNGVEAPGIALIDAELRSLNSD
jgi:hypothetical protein